MVTEMQQRPQPVVPQRGMFFHVFVTNKDTGKRGYLGCYTTEDEAKQYAIEAVGMEGDYTIHPSRHRDPAIAKQEFRHKKFTESGDFWGVLRPIRNIRKGG